MGSEITEEMAVQIYQKMLDQICAAYFGDDFDAYTGAIAVPLYYSTKDNAYEIHNIAQMKEAFVAYRDYLIGLGVTDFIRICNGAAVLSPTKIIGTHTSELLRHGTRLRDPYEAWITLEVVDGTWKVTHSDTSITDTSWQAVAFRQGVRKANEQDPHSGDA